MMFNAVLVIGIVVLILAIDVVFHANLAGHSNIMAL